MEENSGLGCNFCPTFAGVGNKCWIRIATRAHINLYEYGVENKCWTDLELE